MPADINEEQTSREESDKNNTNSFADLQGQLARGYPSSFTSYRNVPGITLGSYSSAPYGMSGYGRDAYQTMDSQSPYYQTSSWSLPAQVPLPAQHPMEYPHRPHLGAYQHGSQTAYLRHPGGYGFGGCDFEDIEDDEYEKGAAKTSTTMHECKADGCTAKFKRMADAQRHYQTVHAKKWSCDAPRCARKGSNGFTRKDHLTEHLRNYHHREIPKRKKRKGLAEDWQDGERKESPPLDDGYSESQSNDPLFLTSSAVATSSPQYQYQSH